MLRFYITFACFPAALLLLLLLFGSPNSHFTIGTRLQTDTAFYFTRVGPGFEG